MIAWMKSPSRPMPKVIDPKTGEEFRVITVVETIDGENGEAAIDECGEVRVEDVLTGEEVKDVPVEKKESE